MTVGVAASIANAALDGMTGGYVKLHVGDPGAAGSANAAYVTTRQALTWASAGATVAGQKAITNQPAWSAWPAGHGQTLTHISVWGSASGTDFKFSAQLGTARAISDNGTFTLNSLTLTLGQLAG